MYPSQLKSAEPVAHGLSMQSYLERLYLESRQVLFRILVGDATADPTQAESLERIHALVEDDVHLENCQQRLQEHFPGQIARMFNLAGKNDQLYPLDKLRESIRHHVARRLADKGENKLDDIDLQALEDMKGSSRLQQQLAYLVDYTPGKWLLQQEIPVVEESRKIRLKANAAGSPADVADGPGATNRGYEPGSDPYIWSRDKGHLRGLCFSGGGIRSATFNLGVLQGLAKRRMLHTFDYLSSVSGGGYIHQWLAAWVKREEESASASGRTGLDVVTQHLIPQPDQACEPHSPEPIKWLRRYSNYLTPELGLTSADLWVTIAIWVRNTFLNQIVLISGLLFAILLPQVFLNFCIQFTTKFPNASGFISNLPGGADVMIVLPFLFSVLVMAWGLFAARHSFRHGRLSNLGLCVLVVVPFMVSAIAYVGRLPEAAQETIRSLATVSEHDRDAYLWIIGGMFLGALFMNCMLTLAGGALTSSGKPERVDAGGSRKRFRLTSVPPVLLRVPGFFLSALLAALVCTAIVSLLPSGVSWLLQVISTLHPSTANAGHQALNAIGDHVRINGETVRLWRLVVAFGPLVIMAILFLGFELHCGLVGRNFSDPVMEWLARARAWITMYSLAWTVWMVISLYGFALIDLLAHSSYHWIQWPAIGTWVLTTLGSVLAGKSRKSSGKANGSKESLLMRTLTAIGPFIYIAGLLVVLSWLARIPLQAMHFNPNYSAMTALVPLFICLLFGWRVDINKFSMHGYYKNRLARCYLGASNTRRDPDPLTGGDYRDMEEMNISNLQPKHGYSGPLPIFCATINISAGEDLAWQERKAASFAFSPLLSGYYVPWTGAHYRGNLSFNGFVPTDCYGNPGGVHISTAAAISGAAVSPDAGFHTSASMAFLLTMFNARLGRWMPNPRRSPLAFDPRAYTAGNCPDIAPHFAPYHLFQELLGKIGDARRFIYLTDGGHFDNMGLYELVRRRCYDIMICDAEQDNGPVFEGIGMAIRKCRIDFGVEIELDLRKLSTNAARLSEVHWVTGKIWYPETEKDKPGRILYIKSSVTGKETADVYNYGLQHPTFPQDSTTDQWFTESQFESYRRLGQQVVDTCPYLQDFMTARTATMPV